MCVTLNVHELCSSQVLDIIFYGRTAPYLKFGDSLKDNKGQDWVLRETSSISPWQN